MSDSIFTRIVKGEVPAHVIYEDGQTLAMLDIHPKTPGHTLVIPKIQVEFVWDLSDEDYQAVMATVKQVARRLRQVLGQPFIGSQIIGVDVPHAHVHVFAFSSMEQYSNRPDMSAEPDQQALAAMAKRLAF